MSKAKLAGAAVLVAVWLCTGLYLSGGITLLLLGLDLAEARLLLYLDYLRYVDAPWLQAAAGRIRWAGWIGFSLPLLLATAVFVALRRLRSRHPCRPEALGVYEPLPQTGPQHGIEQVTASLPIAEEADMNLHALSSPVLAASLAVSGCSSLPAVNGPDGPPLTVEQANARAPFLPPLPPVVMSGELADEGDPVKTRQMNYKAAKWPLRFEGTFGFGARCVNTLSCSIPYVNSRYELDKPVYADEKTYSKARVDAFGGGYISPEFPDPVQVSWRSLDGVQHHAQIDLEAIFGDRRVLHVVPREEVMDMPDGRYRHMPDLLIEVNDRTIHVYMRAYVPTWHLQIPGNRHTGSRDDLILARSFHY